jgi:hypothetical protein
VGNTAMAYETLHVLIPLLISKVKKKSGMGKKRKRRRKKVKKRKQTTREIKWIGSQLIKEITPLFD